MVDFNPQNNKLAADLKNLLNWGKNLAATDNGADTNKIEGDARIIFGGAVKGVAQSQGVDESQIYSDAGIASLMGATFEGKAPKIDPLLAEMAQYFDGDKTKLNNYMTAAIKSGADKRVANTTEKIELITDAFAQKPAVFSDDDISSMWALAGMTGKTEPTETQDVANANFAQLEDNGIDPNAFNKAADEYWG